MSLALLTRYGLTRAPAGGGGETGYGIESFTPATTSSAAQLGWQFTVGASNVDVDRLRVYMGASGSETVYLWRVSDQALLASQAIEAVGGQWAEVSLGTPVTLAAGQDYVVSTHRAGTSRVIQNILSSAATFSSALTYVQARFVSDAGFPSSVVAGRLYGLPDFRWVT